MAKKEIKKYRQTIHPSKISVDVIFKSLRENRFPQWNRFLEVDVWKKNFTEIQTMAIFDIYSQKFNISFGEARRLNFTHCVDSLRKLEDGDYTPHKNKQQ